MREGDWEMEEEVMGRDREARGGMVVQFWRERSASVASLCCLAVRLGAAMGGEER